MICSVVGARPNFIKMAPVIQEITRRGLPQQCVHTGQHYDAAMSDIFFDQLGMPRPDLHLGVGSGSHAAQTARTMAAFEQVCLDRRPDLVLVSGDVNSTLACALVAAKLQISVAHVESGLRSFDRTMPEEINRVLTDHLSDLLFTTEPSAAENLLREGIASDQIAFVGNTMIDSLLAHLPRALQQEPWHSLGLTPHEYGVVTLHRPALVDHAEALDEVRLALLEISHEVPLCFPVHPRTRMRLESGGLPWGSVRLLEPVGYLEFLGLIARARLVLTDSGGVQEETTALGVPCVTLRPNTERPVTVQSGTNRLAGTSREAVVAAARAALQEGAGSARLPDRWDGQAAVRLVDVVARYLSGR